MTNQKFVAPVQELAELNVASIEKLVSITLKGIEESAKIGVESLKQAAAIKDLEGVKTYVSAQAEVIRKAVESVTARSKSVVDVAQAYPVSVKKIFDNALAA
jgi:phasin family protein